MNHFYRKLNGWFNYQEFYSKQVENFPDGSKFVEVGCFEGRSAAFLGVEIINSKKQISLDLVDLFDSYDPLIKNIPTIEEVKENLKPLIDLDLKFIKSLSWEAANYYPNRSLDFVFIDASHAYEDVKRDIDNWLPKIKTGGVISGHDYDMKGVKRAVDETFEGKFKLDKNVWYLTVCWYLTI